MYFIFHLWRMLSNRTLTNWPGPLFKRLRYYLIIFLEYAVQIWNPRLLGDIGKIERVQRRSTRITLGFTKFQYEDRLKRFRRTTLKDSRLRGDLIEMYKVTSSRESINWVKSLKLKKNVDISVLAVIVRRNSLLAQRLISNIF